MRLRWDDDAEAFRRELDDWLDANLPPTEQMREPKLSSAHLPDWAREWQRTLFEAGWLVPGWPPELGGRNARPVQQMIYFEEFARRDVPHSLNPEGLSICAASIHEYADINEMFFTDVVVPRDNLLGELHGGWPITQGSLGHERGMLWIGNASNIESGVNQLVELGRELGLGSDSRFSDQVASLYID